MYVYVTLTQSLKCVLKTQIHSFGEGCLLHLLTRLKAHVGDQMEDTQRTPAQNDLSTTCHVRQVQLFYFVFDNKRSVLPCKMIS